MSDDGKRAWWPAVLLKRGLLLFWAAWLSLVFATNLLDGAKALGLLSDRILRRYVAVNDAGALTPQRRELA